MYSEVMAMDDGFESCCAFGRRPLMTTKKTVAAAVKPKQQKPPSTPIAIAMVLEPALGSFALALGASVVGRKVVPPLALCEGFRS